MRFRKILIITYLGGLILIPIVLFALPADFFDHGESVCLSVLIFDQECYACGMTRGIQHLLHLVFLRTSEFNKLSYIVLPVLVYLWIKELIRAKRMLGKEAKM